jgi:hypothetical protein
LIPAASVCMAKKDKSDARHKIDALLNSSIMITGKEWFYRKNKL